MNEDEMRLHTPVVISCNEGRREVAAVQSIANKQIDRTFVFDKVFLNFDYMNCIFKVVDNYLKLFSYCYLHSAKFRKNMFLN
jgi:hypothetical protein